MPSLGLSDETYVEQATVNELGHRVSYHGGLSRIQTRHNLLASGDQLLLQGPFSELLHVDAEELRRSRHSRVIRVYRRFVTGRFDLDISKVKQGSK